MNVIQIAIAVFALGCAVHAWKERDYGVAVFFAIMAAVLFLLGNLE